MQYLLLFVLAAQAAAMWMTTSVEKPFTKPVATDNHRAIARVTSSTATTTTNTQSPSIAFSTLMTIAPLSRNPLELRQRCFNDQGFSVNCATWTGYYYTWGGAGHPYEGGPGEGGGSGNSNGAANSVLRSKSRFERLRLSVLGPLLTVCLLVLL